MQYSNRVVLACAGSGKTTSIVDEACNNTHARSALVTYTINGAGELSKNAHQRYGHVPPSVTISTWFSFLLRHFVRPYQNYLYAPRISRINFNQGQSAKYIPATDVRRHYFSQSGTIYRDKVSKFACEVIQKTGGLPVRRFKHVSSVFISMKAKTSQGSISNWWNIFLKSKTNVIMVGDHRQATYTTNDAKKNKRYARAKIVDKFEEWRRAGFCTIEYQTESQRCVQSICDFADRLYPGLPKTASRNNTVTEHDGVCGTSE